MTFAYSRGRSIHDSRPNTRTAPDFAAFVEAIARERAPSKVGAPYIAGPFNGDGRRCAEGALPRRWIALDFDRIDAETLPELRMWLARFKGVAWPTHSSTPDAPRERVILELDRDASRDECLAIGEALSADLAAEFGDAIALDASTFRPEQPIFVPPAGATLARFEGEPLDVDAYIAATKKGRADAPERPRSGERDADILVAIERGESLHESILRLVARMAGKGLDAATIKASAIGLLERARPERGDRVDELARDELDRMIEGAVAKYARPAGEPQPMDIFRESVAPAIAAEDFPPLLADFAVLLARASGHDPAAYLMAGLATAAGAMSDDVRIQLDARTSFFVSALLWVLLLGAPGTAKTPAIRATMSALFHLHRELRAQHAQAVAGLPKDEPQPPLPAVFVNDATIEKLSEILADNPRGIIAVFEELDTWLGAHDCYRGGQGSKDRGEWLRLFDGGPHQVDRIRRGSYFVPNWGASILGATTPAGLRRHAKDLPADGLIQRFLPVIVRPMVAPEHAILGAEVRRAREAYEERLRELFAAPPGVVKLSRGAAEIFEARRDALRKEVEAFAAMSEPFAGHLTKHASLLGRLALAMHGLEHGAAVGSVEVSGETMARAERLLRKLARHALAMFEMLEGNDGPVGLARAAGRSIVAGRFETVNRSELMKHCRAFRDASEHQREAALRYLEDAAWLTPLNEGRQYSGRAAWFAVTPEVLTRFADQGEELRRRRDAVRELIG